MPLRIGPKTAPLRQNKQGFEQVSLSLHIFADERIYPRSGSEMDILEVPKARDADLFRAHGF